MHRTAGVDDVDDSRVYYVKGDLARKSFSKTILVKLTMAGVHDKSMLVYCIIDECSNTTLVSERVVEFFGKPFPKQRISIGFADRSSSRSEGFVVTGLSVEGLDSAEIVEIPKAISQPEIANTRSEVAT